MNRIPVVRCCAALAVCVLFPALAAAADYTYLEGGFIDRHDYGTDGGGVRVAGSFGLPLMPLAVFGEYDSTDNLDQFDVGALFHAPLLPVLDLFGGASLEHADVHDHSDTGIGARAGVRWRVLPQLELAPELRYVDLYHDGQTSVRLNALYRIAPRLDLQAAVQGGDERRFEAGLRFNF
ncbi:MAG: hypothetical protein IRZ06_03290 [Nevskia sp.]|nr:hypothetical protein [Nevskia sp.]